MRVSLITQSSQGGFSGTYRGEYSPTSPQGGPNFYAAGDSVIYEGKLFFAKTTIIGVSPDLSDQWIAWGGSRVSYRSTIPPDPMVGDKWVNKANGRMYTYFDDGESKQFVEF